MEIMEIFKELRLQCRFPCESFGVKLLIIGSFICQSCGTLLTAIWQQFIVDDSRIDDILNLQISHKVHRHTRLVNRKSVCIVHGTFPEAFPGERISKFGSHLP